MTNDIQQTNKQSEIRRYLIAVFGEPMNYNHEKQIAAHIECAELWGDYYAHRENTRLADENRAYAQFRKLFAKEMLNVAKNPVKGQFQLSLSIMSGLHDHLMDELDSISKRNGEQQIEEMV